MKSLVVRSAVLVAGFAVIMSCARNDSSPRELDDQLSLAEKETVFEAVLQKADDQVDKEIAMLEKYNYNLPAGKGNETEPCTPKITVSTPPDAKFPKTITLDYGEGCVDANGIFRAGQVVVRITGPYWEKNTERLSKLVDYWYNDIRIAGQRNEVNKGQNEKGNFIFEIKHIEKIWNDKDELLSERNWTRKREHNRGDVKMADDDQIWVTGRAKIKTNGRELVKEITEPLFRTTNCNLPHFQKGIIVTYYENKKTGELNYGDGDCDNIATWTNKEGVTKEIHLKTWINLYSVKP
jgi:hypothetical protein